MQKIEEGTTYRIKFIKDIEIDIYAIEDPDTILDTRSFIKEETDTVTIVEIDEKKQVATLFWDGLTTDEIDVFAPNVPMDCFQLVQKRIITWEKV